MPPVPVAEFDDDALVAELEATSVAESVLAARKAAVVHERQRRRGDAVDVLGRQLGMGGRRARAAVETAKGLQQLAATRDALAAGEITHEHAEVSIDDAALGPASIAV